MELYKDDLGFNVPADTADSGMLVAPSSNAPGINLAAADSPTFTAPPANSYGIGIQQAPAPVADAAISPVAQPASRFAQQQDSRKQVISQMAPMEKLLSAFGEFGAGILGRPSPIDARIKQQREEHLIQMEEGKANIQMFSEGLKVLDRIPAGTERDAFAASYSKQMGDLAPAFETVAKQPGMAERLLKYAPESPTLARAFAMDPTGKLAGHLLESDGGNKTINMEIDSKRMPIIVQKATALLSAAQELAPDIHKAIVARGYAVPGDITRLSEAAKTALPKAALDNTELDVMTRHEDATLGTVPGVAVGKTQQDILKKKAEKDAETGMKPGHTFSAPAGDRSVVTLGYDPAKTIWPKAERDPNGFAILGKGEKDRPPNITVEAPVQMHTDLQNRLWERKRGGAWALATGPGGVPISGNIKEAADKPYQDVDKARAQYNLDYPISMAGMRTPKGGKPVPEFNTYYQNEWQKTKQITGIGDGEKQPAKPAGKSNALPAGIPAGSKLIGKTPDGKSVYQSPDGKKWVP